MDRRHAKGIKLFYIPKQHRVIGKLKGKFYNFPDCSLTEKPQVLIPCKALWPEENNSDMYSISDSYLNHIKEYTDDNKLKIHKVELEIEVDDNYIILKGYLPKYVLNGIVKLMCIEYEN